MIKRIKLLPDFGKDDLTYLMYKELNKRFETINNLIDVLNKEELPEANTKIESKKTRSKHSPD